MTKDQKRESLELLIKSYKSKLLNNATMLGKSLHDTSNYYNFLDSLDKLSELAGDIVELQKEYDNDYPKTEFTADDIPF